MSWLEEIYNSRKRGIKYELEAPLMKALFRIFDNSLSFGLRERVGQQNMALDIAESYINGQNAMIEAGVGIGKSFGYLIPSLYINHLTRQPIIVATSSIQLSEQINRDLKTISQRLGFPHVRSVVGKGMGQYACRHRAAELISLEGKIPPVVEGILNYEINERADIPDGITDAEWSKLCVTNCKFERCFHKAGCTFYDMRAKINARTSDIDFIIVNQDLLIRNLIKKREGSKALINDRPAMIVIDEAHNLEAKVRDARTMDFTFHSISRILDNALQLLLKQTGDRNLLYKGKFIKQSVDQIYKIIEGDLAYSSKQDNDRIKVSPLRGIPFDLISQEMHNFSIGLSLVTAKNEREVDNVSEALESLTVLFDILKGEEGNYLIWATKPKNEATISICPKDISHLLRYMLFSEMTPVILTSATLCQSGEKLRDQYAYLTQSLGYRGEYMERQISPFDYTNHAMMYISNNIPYYNHQNREIFLEAAYKEMIRLCDLIGGRTLVLFSAKEDMKYIHEKCKTEKLNWSLHVQKEGSSQDEVIKEFRESKGVLLGTGVFWEGVNIEGSDLSQVIIFRLPFPVPADPVYEYKASVSHDPQNEVYLPDMLIRLRQGTGRLIRSETDLGLLSILDSRLSAAAKREYRGRVLDTLPFKVITEEFSTVESFVKQNGIQTA